MVLFLQLEQVTEYYVILRDVLIYICFTLTNPQIVVSDKASDELAVQQVVRRIDGANAVVCVVGGTHAEAEGPRCPERRSAPVVVVMTEAVHSF